MLGRVWMADCLQHACNMRINSRCSKQTTMLKFAQLKKQPGLRIYLPAEGLLGPAPCMESQ